MNGHNLTDFIKIYDGVLSQEHCDLIIEDYKRNEHLVEHHDTPLYKFQQLNLNKDKELSELANAFIGTLLPCFEDYFKSLGMSEYVSLENFEEVRIKKYLKDTESQFKTHVDVSDHASASRFCVAILYLNDNDGLTTFPNLGVAVLPKAGRVVMFPPTWMFPHSGLPSHSDDKYIMMTCLRYV